MNTTDELDIIAHIRGEVQSSKEPTGENLFLAWGYPTAFFLLVEFVALILWNKNWCEWIWMGIPMVGAPLMVYFGFAGVFEQCYCMFQGLLIGMGCFLTGLILRYRPKVVCGIIGSALSFLPLFFQGEYWHWQLLIAAGVTIIALVIPGHLFHNYVKQQTQASL